VCASLSTPKEHEALPDMLTPRFYERIITELSKLKLENSKLTIDI